MLAEIRAAKWFSIPADKATDISHNEQMSLSIHWMDNSNAIHEEAIAATIVRMPQLGSLPQLLNV